METVPKHTYDELMRKYKNLLEERDDLQKQLKLMEEDVRVTNELNDALFDLIDEPDHDRFHASEDEEDEDSDCLRVDFRPDTGIEISKPEKRKKFAGASIEFDPYKRSLGFGFHFKEVDD